MLSPPSICGCEKAPPTLHPLMKLTVKNASENCAEQPGTHTVYVQYNKSAPAPAFFCIEKEHSHTFSCLKSSYIHQHSLIIECVYCIGKKALFCQDSFLEDKAMMKCLFFEQAILANLK